MDVRDLISALDYDKSSSFIDRDHFGDDPSKAHVFRRAHEYCGLQGVYALTDRSGREGVPGITPVVYVCDSEAAEKKAKENPDELHRLVWNQNASPFLVVVTPGDVRLYPGFQYDPEKPLIRREDTIAKAAAALRELRLDAASIDEGAVWRRMDEYVTSETRVDWDLLENLRDLGEELRRDGHLAPSTAHALIGKYVYLRYLRDRDVLSNRKFERWGLSQDIVFGRNATLAGLREVVDRLEKRLNGAIFPLPLSGSDAPCDEDVRLVASTFKGDEPRSGQMHLGFEAYDFSHIPIETLSNVYEQFLHAEREGDEETTEGRGKKLGAYYTPVHLVDFILDELDSKRRLTEGMKVLDPACGSGAFLVQAYRRLVERERPEAPDGQLTPSRLRKLLVDTVFGVDKDKDACRVAHLSLSLTLLDYVEPPDLEGRYREFRMPNLMETNIFHCPEGFFDPQARWQKEIAKAKFDWIASNPPWRDIESKTDEPAERHVLEWMEKETRGCPTGGNQIAEAFAWRIADYLEDDGLAGVLMPAMTLFKLESRGFRKQFFSDLDVWCVANFANLREVLFTGPAMGKRRGRTGRKRSKKKKRARLPAAAIFYGLPPPEEEGIGDSILTYAPFVATQEVDRATSPKRRKDVWKVVVDASEIREISRGDVATGESLVWKAAMWGLPRDMRLIRSLRSRFAELGAFAGKHGLAIHQGVEFRKPGSGDIEFCKELVGKNKLVMQARKMAGSMYSVPPQALATIQRDEAYLREGRNEVPLSICRPPHVIVDVSRKFAVFSDKFIAVPARQIGIAGPQSNAKLLKAIALLLNSTFSRYHDFMVSPQWGIHVGISTQSTLKSMPMPFGGMSAKDISRWAALYDKLAKADRARLEFEDTPLLPRTGRGSAKSVAKLEVELNRLVYDAFGLDEDERALVEDMVRVKMGMIESKWNESHVRSATKPEMKDYARTLGRTLDGFLDKGDGLRHEVAVLYGRDFAWITVTLAKKRRGAAVKIEETSGRSAGRLAEVRQRLRREHGQWFYFNRTLRIFEGRTTHMTKPMYRLAWLKSQALADADDLIADILNGEGG
ncbi:MAG: HsdM family class I SAM-dependent methyltransferase [Planctomycetota bacterium]|jgi:hypothetical protein